MVDQFEYNSLVINDTYIIFISDYQLAITKNPENILENYNIETLSKDFKKTSNFIGTTNFHIKVKLNNFSLYLNQKKYPLKNFNVNKLDYENSSLYKTSRFVAYTLEKSLFIALKQNNYLYLKKQNIYSTLSLGNIFYFGDISNHVDITKKLSKLSIPYSTVIFDKKEDECSKASYTNDSSSDIIFLNDPTLDLGNTGTKPIITYKFSKNNTKNFFDANSLLNFEDLRNFLRHDLNYNKFYIPTNTTGGSDINFLIRLIQFKIMLPTLFIDYNQSNTIQISEDNEDFKIFQYYLGLRHRLTPFLYGVFKNNKQPYYQDTNQLVFGKTLLFNPIYTELDPMFNQNYIHTYFNDIYYDVLTGEKISKPKFFDFYPKDRMPIFAVNGTILPLKILNTNKYEIKVYPGQNNNYTLYDNDHNEIYFKLRYDSNKIKLSVSSLNDIPPLYINFINLKETSDIKVNQEYKTEYNNDFKYITLNIDNKSNIIEIEISNQFGIELNRNHEFLHYKLENFFRNFNCSKEYNDTYKYKVEPYLHESKENIISKINKNFPFLKSSHKKKLYKLIDLYFD